MECNLSLESCFFFLSEYEQNTFSETFTTLSALTLVSGAENMLVSVVWCFNSVPFSQTEMTGATHCRASLYAASFLLSYSCRSVPFSISPVHLRHVATVVYNLLQ